MEGSNIINESSVGFLRSLSPAIRKCPYNGSPPFIEIWENERHQRKPTTRSEWILLTGVDEKTFSQRFLNHPHPPQWSSYDKVLNLLLVRMTKSITHEDSAIIFHNKILQAVIAKGLDPDLLVYCGRATRQGSVGAKEADFAYLPREFFNGASEDWPSVVLETAFSEDQSKLVSDVRFWLNGSEGKVKIVFTMKIHSKSNVTIDKWEPSDGRSHRTQHIEIMKRNNGNVLVSGHPLVLEFEKLLLRAGNGPQETDIVFDETQLKSLASHIWQTYSKEYPN